MTGPAAVPPTLSMSVVESFQLEFATANDLSAGGGTSPTNASSTLVNISTGLPVVLANSPTVTDTDIFQWVRGPTELVVPGRFLLTVTFTASPSSNIFAMELVVIATV